MGCQYLAHRNPARTLVGIHIRNVKKGLIANPVKKQYGREQIAYLFFIAVVKSVLSMEDLQVLIRLQQLTYPLKKSYDYFRLELQNVLEFVFEQKEEMELVGVETSREKAILRNAIIAVAHKVYINQMLAAAADKISDTQTK